MSKKIRTLAVLQRRKEVAQFIKYLRQGAKSGTTKKPSLEEVKRILPGLRY